jgi:tryptophan synthase beta chain
MQDNKITLSPAEVPTKWYNLAADLPSPVPPPLNPGTLQPIGPEALAPIFPMALIEQEVSRERWIPIPEEVLNILMIWRPSPLVRARRLEQALGTPAKIYYKNESYSPPGSHKPNTAVAQAYYNKKEGVKRIATETGAGQWGSALAFATNMFGLKCTIYMVRVSYEQKPYRKMLMQCWGAECFPSPTNRTHAGRAILEKDPNTLGSLGIAISEAVEDAATHDDTKYSLGSVLSHVCMHQTIVGLEAKKQFEKVDAKPDILIGCVGGGSNFSGFAFPFVKDKIDGRDMHIIAAEPHACPSLTKGEYRYDFGDTAMTTPLLAMHTLGHSFVPAGIHAGGLRYHGDAPILCHAVKLGLIEAQAVHQIEAFEAGVLFARTEGHVPAPETSHAIAVAVREANKCKETGEAKTIAFNYSGHGFFDLSAYEKYFAGELQDFEYPAEAIKKALAELPVVKMG